VKFIALQLALLALGGSIARAQSLPNAPSETFRSTSQYQPITADQRLHWFVNNTVGPETLAVGLFSAGLGTARDKPVEYGPHWEGFSKRYGMRLTGVSVGNAMEAGLGALWGEDPRYFPDIGGTFKDRIRHVLVMAFVAHDRQGNPMPAYARYISTPGNNFLSNTWRAPSESTNGAAALRTLWGFVGLMGKNAFVEFWPDVQTHLPHRKR
jgi:hypothetical protein